LLAAVLLSACGGGGGNPGTTNSGGTTGTGSGSGTGTGNGTVTATPTLTMDFSNAGGTASNALSGATPLTIKATLLGADKKPVPNTVVQFTTDDKLATFSPTAGSALTDANGVATLTMRAASLSAGGAGTVTATANVAGTDVNAKGSYSVGATALTFGTLTATPSSLQAYGSTVLSVDLLAGSAKYTDQQVNVSFSSACVAAGKATLATVVPTNNGTAQTVFRDKGCGNNDTITVSADGVSKSATVNLTIAPPAAASVQFVSASPTDQSIVIQGQGGNGRTETATLTFKVVDIFGQPLAGEQVNFSTATSTVKINKLSDTTDASGNVITTVNSGSVPTTFRVLATLPGTGTNGGPDISTLSDSIVVTTGLPVQRAFSLSAGTFNVEGWDYDSAPDKPATYIQALIADTNGNPVPDGTPVVFQTNMGSIGSSSKGGCLTVNGGCSVDLRAQAPRSPALNTPSTPCNGSLPGATNDNTRTAVATICASTTDGKNTVFAPIYVFFSSSHLGKVYMNGSSTPLDWSAGPIDLGSSHSDTPKQFTLELNDVNQNPMPSDTTVAVTAIVNGSAAMPTPSTVQSVAPATGAHQGTVHSFTISSPGGTNCQGPANTTFNVAVTTPRGNVSFIPFKLLFTCP
jgi:hypothetical protein